MPKIARARALDLLPEPVCPAASAVAGATPGRCGFICRVVQQDRERERALGVTPAQAAFMREGGGGDTFLTIETDPSSVLNLCSGDAVPVLGEREVPGNRASYTYCPVWQAEKQRIADGRRQLAGGGLAEPEPVSHFDDGRGGASVAPAGSSYASDDPWAQARRDLDVLAPVGP
jgi:hypothetical protein